MILSGDSLITIIANDNLRQLFLSLACSVEAVIACRLSPKQKAEIVNLMKAALPEKVLLAIGDGANDVNMITEANVGVGMAGLEGS